MTKRLTTEEFISKAKVIHGNKYDYSKVEYKDAKTKVCILCSDHGEFWQIPNVHIAGFGCPTCSSKKKKDKIQFIAESNIIHKYKYNYSKVEYKNNHEKVCIICSEHG